MVTLSKIYTRGGDRGQTSLGDGTRVAKHDHRVAAYGTVDEANATIGIARQHLDGEADAMLARIQNDLFRPGGASDEPAGLRIAASQVERLEREIDRLNTELAPLNSFVLPGGSPAGAHLHLARTVVRRAERLCTGLGETEAVNPEAIRYLNRLADHLFVLSRWVNDKGSRDVLWVPGANRQA